MRKVTRTWLGMESLERRDVPADVSSLAGLQARMADQMDTATGRSGFGVLDLADNSFDSLRADEVFGTSSTIKLGILYALMVRIDRSQSSPLPAQRINLSTLLNVGSQYGSNQDGNVAANQLSENTSYTLESLASRMIDFSNNWATNRLINLIGINFINDCFADLGLTRTRVDRYMTGPGSPSMHGTAGVGSDYRAGHDNESTPREITTLLRRIHENSAFIGPTLTDAFWRIMELNNIGGVTQTFNTSVFTGPGVSWNAALTTALKSGNNVWTGSLGDFTDDPGLGNHFQRSEAGRIRFSDNRVIFYAMFVDEAANDAVANASIGRGGFEIAREFAPAALTITPDGAELTDGRVVRARGTAGKDRFEIFTPFNTNRISVGLNGTLLQSVDPSTDYPYQYYYIDGGAEADTFIVAAGTSPVNLGRVELIGGDGGDTFDVTSSTAVIIAANGGLPVGQGGDRLLYRGPGAFNIPPFSGGGQVDRSGHFPVLLSGIDFNFAAPTVSALPDVNAAVGTSTTLNFTVADLESPSSALTVTATTTNSNLFAFGNVRLGGTGLNRTVQVVPALGVTGSAVVTITVRDEIGATSSTSFDVAIGATLVPPPIVPPPIVPPPNPPVPPANTAKPTVKEFSVGTDNGGSVTLRNPDNTIRFTSTPFGAGFTGGIRTASADFTGDGIADLAVASGPGRSGQVLIFDGVSQAEVFAMTPFGEEFIRGVLVAGGDMNADGRAELVITAEQGGGARVRIFNSTVGGFVQRADFFGLVDGAGRAVTEFRGGSRATVGDIDGDGVGDLIFAAGAGGGPRIAVFSGVNLKTDGGPKLIGDFFALDSALRDGAYIAAGDFNGDGFADLVAGGGSGAGPQVVVFSGRELLQNQRIALTNFFFGNPDTRRGVRVAARDLDGDDRADLIVGSAPSAGSRVAAYPGRGLTPTGPGAPLFEFDGADNSNGIFVG